MDVKDRLGPLPIFYAMETRRWRATCQAIFEMNVALPEAAMGTTVTGKGQVTIPKRVRDLPGIGPGSAIDLERARDDRVVLAKVGKKVRPNRFARLRSHAGKGLGTTEIMS